MVLMLPGFYCTMAEGCATMMKKGGVPNDSTGDLRRRAADGGAASSAGGGGLAGDRCSGSGDHLHIE